MSAPRDPPPLVRFDHPDPAAPVLVTGLGAAAVLAGDGTFRCLRETRGGLLDWGGVYGQGIRLTGPWGLRVTLGGELGDLAASFRSGEAWRWAVRFRYQMTAEVQLEDTIVPLVEAPGVGRRLLVRNAGATPVQLGVTTVLPPFLAPVLVEGLKPYSYEVEANADGVVCRSHANRLTLCSSRSPVERSLDGRPWNGERWSGELGGIETRYEGTVGPRAVARLDELLWGGVANSLPSERGFGPGMLAAADAWEPAARRAWSAWIAGTPTLSFPSDPLLERAYEVARGALRSLYARPTPELTGLVAGYPWYCAIWGRDLAWMLPAATWLGDFEWVEQSLRSMLRFQATRSIPLLAAEVGELPMQLSPGPVFLYGTADTTLYYPGVLEGLVAHGGDREIVDELWPHVLNVLRWMEAKTQPESGLLTHGGEVLALRDATERIGSIHVGIDAADTTIWDSADRRDHAIDVQVLARSARAAIVSLATRASRLSELPGETADDGPMVESIRRRYAWPAEGYLYDSLSKSGAPVAKLRPNALRAISAGILEPDHARQVLERSLRSDLSTDWGLRTLASTDPAYDPQAYHEGQVWTIATAWAADAALALGDRERGHGLLRTIAARLLAEGGLANECYRGDRPEPFDSCFLLGFSVAPFLSILFERLWGITMDAQRPWLSVRPKFPDGWTDASLRGLRLGEGRVDLVWHAGKVDVRWSGPGTLDVAAGRTLGSVDPGKSRELAVLL